MASHCRQFLRTRCLRYVELGVQESERRRTPSGRGLREVLAGLLERRPLVVVLPRTTGLAFGGGAPGRVQESGDSYSSVRVVAVVGSLEGGERLLHTARCLTVGHEVVAQ